MKTNEQILDEMCFVDDNGKPIKSRKMTWSLFSEHKPPEDVLLEVFIARHQKYVHAEFCARKDHLEEDDHILL